MPGASRNGLHLGRRVVEPQRLERGRLHEQLAGRRVVDLVVARRPLDERHLLADRCGRSRATGAASANRR